MHLIYDVEDKPKFKQNIVFAIQQVLAIIAATLLVPVLVNSIAGVEMMNQAAALLGAGCGTLVYVLFTKKKSPVFLGSSFAFITPLAGACAFGYFGIILGAVFAGAVYVVIAILIHFVGTKWVDKLMPPVVIGPTVALIGLSLCSSAVSNLTSAADGSYNLIAIVCGIVAFLATVVASVKGSKTAKLFPFIIGILSGYVLAAIFTFIGMATDCAYLMLIDFSPLVNNFADLSVQSFISLPSFTFVEAFKEGLSPLGGSTGVAQIAVLFAPVAFVVLAEHIADHKNLGSIIGRDLIKEPGLKRTLLGDGIGSIVGSIFGGCPNTTYGESIGCVAITGNASVSTTILTAVLCIVLSFLTPLVVFIQTIPTCVVGGICFALYGFIAVSGLKMLQVVDLGENHNLFVVSAILVPGIGGLALDFGSIQITSIATALVIGIITNVLLSKKKEAKTK